MEVIEAKEDQFQYFFALRIKFELHTLYKNSEIEHQKQILFFPH